MRHCDDDDDCDDACDNDDCDDDDCENKDCDDEELLTIDGGDDRNQFEPFMWSKLGNIFLVANFFTSYPTWRCISNPSEVAFSLEMHHHLNFCHLKRERSDPICAQPKIWGLSHDLVSVETRLFGWTCGRCRKIFDFNRCFQDSCRDSQRSWSPECGFKMDFQFLLLFCLFVCLLCLLVSFLSYQSLVDG